MNIRRCRRIMAKELLARISYLSLYNNSSIITVYHHKTIQISIILQSRTKASMTLNNLWMSSAKKRTLASLIRSSRTLYNRRRYQRSSWSRSWCRCLTLQNLPKRTVWWMKTSLMVTVRMAQLEFQPWKPPIETRSAIRILVSTSSEARSNFTTCRMRGLRAQKAVSGLQCRRLNKARRVTSEPQWAAKVP